MSETPQELYGRLREGADIIGYTAARAQQHYFQLVEDDCWRELGFGEFGEFVATIDLSVLAGSRSARLPIEADMHERGALGIQIAEAFGIHKSTVSRDLNPPEPSALNATEDRDEAEEELQDATEAEDGSEEESVLWPDNQHEQEDRLAEDRDEAEEELQDATEAEDGSQSKPEPAMLTLHTHTGEEVLYPEPQSKATFNQTDGDGISWASWSWNPVTGCLHGCDYCYARAIAARWADAYPAGFTPVFHPERLDAPANTVIPAAHAGDPAWRRVFVCSMADLYGRWVPDEWIEQVHESMLANPQWQYILLTKFPDRYPGLAIPPGAWAGTSVHEQKRVRIAERAFRQLDADVKWLSLEPFLEPLKFADLSMFDWIVIGAQTETRQPGGVTVPGFQPDPKWVTRILAQAAEAGIPVHVKPNMTRFRAWLDSYPGGPGPKGEAHE